jgi:sigma-B regulation protein RsbU (phosphoserine phosphatase)
MTEVGPLHDILYLFSETEIFVFVFMEVMTRVDITHRITHNKATVADKIIFILIFGGFSIFGTYIGIKLPSGAISNVRDFGPMIAGLVGGPLLGFGAGVIGGVHRFFMGGFTNISCGLATMCAGLICGLVHHFRNGKLVNIYQGALIAFSVEIIHALITLLIARPFADAVEVIKTAIPPMMIANIIGVIIAILLLQHHYERASLD